MKKLAFILTALVLFSLTTAAGVQATVPPTIRLEVFKAVKTALPDWATPQVANDFVYEWQPLACDGSDVLDGVQNVRVVGYAYNPNTVPIYPRLRVTYTPGERWYEYVFPELKPSVETLVFDSIQDVEKFDQFGKVRTSSGFTMTNVGSQETPLTCNFGLQNITGTSNGFISHRSYADQLVTLLGIEVLRYGDHLPIPCGSTGINVNRVQVTLYATAPTGVYDLHAHVETMPTTGIGPDQNGNGTDKRWWEIALDDTPIPHKNTALGPASNNIVGSLTSNIAGNQGTIHFAQQTGPGQPKNEMFCSFGP